MNWTTRRKDAHGQPLVPLSSNLQNNFAKAFDETSGLCAGILADGIVNETEARFFGDWMERYRVWADTWPLSDFFARIDRIFQDGVVDDEEREELKIFMEMICGRSGSLDSTPDETNSTRLPLDEQGRAAREQDLHGLGPSSLGQGHLG